MIRSNADASRQWAEAHPQPESPTPTPSPVVVQTQSFPASGITVARIGPKVENWRPSQPPLLAPQAPAPASVELRQGVEVERSRERDSAGNPMVTRIKL